MPIYEYQAINPLKGCTYCRNTFEVLQRMGENPKRSCPRCGRDIKKVISRCHAAVLETPEANERAEKSIKGFEKEGMWSHAAELADKHSEKTKDKALKMRALDNYKKAGYDAHTLEKHAKISDD